MMKKKLRNAIFEYTNNSRITTKELGKKINSSQQSASYLLKSLRDKGVIKGETTVVDTVKLGYTNTFIGFNYAKLDSQSQRDVLSELKDVRDVVGIEESTEGFDLLVEFSTRNLAALNKAYTDLMSKLDGKLNTFFIFPVITRCKYPRKYLKSVRNFDSRVLFDDEKPLKISDNDLMILKMLVKEPTKKLVTISEESGMNVKTVVKIKKYLEKKLVIHGYEAILDNRKLGISREILFLRFFGGGLDKIDKFIEFSRAHKNIIQVDRVIGSSHAIVVVEGLEDFEIIKEIRSLFPIENYMIFKSSQIHRKSYLVV